MCDYSLDLVASRPAKVGDELVTTQFKNSITRGFAAIGEPNVAVCLLPGTALEFPDGETVLLTQLCEGQHATVLQLPASRPVNAAEGQKRDSLVNQSGAHYRACLAVPLVGEGAHREQAPLCITHKVRSGARRGAASRRLGMGIKPSRCARKLDHFGDVSA